MNEQKNKIDHKIDRKEFDLPETVFIRDIENRVFQGIVLQSLSQIEGIALVEGNFIDSLLGRGLEAGVKGISAEQDLKNHSVAIKVEINICYGFSIPAKAEEIQSKITEDLIKLTGLHVASVHVIFKNVISVEEAKNIAGLIEQSKERVPAKAVNIEEDYSEDF